MKKTEQNWIKIDTVNKNELKGRKKSLQYEKKEAQTQQRTLRTMTDKKTLDKNEVIRYSNCSNYLDMPTQSSHYYSSIVL